jgi:hypothetical protein
MARWPAPESRVPFFVVTTLDGRRCAYSEIWQRSQLLLVVCPAEPDDVWRVFEERLDGARPQAAALETELVVTRTPLGEPSGESHPRGPRRPPGATATGTPSGGSDQPQPADARHPGPGGPIAVVADRWAEVTHSAALERRGNSIDPDVETLLRWVEATLHRCPECEGEAR